MGGGKGKRADEGREGERGAPGEQPRWSFLVFGFQAEPLAPSKTEPVNVLAPVLLSSPHALLTHILIPLSLTVKEIHAH